MLDHTGFIVTDIKAARMFYDAVAGVLGLGTKDIGPSAFLLGKGPEDPTPYLWIGTEVPSYWAKGSRPGINQCHVAFKADSKEQVDALHAAGLKAGGTDNGKPGQRVEEGVYAAFVLDPDGNNIEACYREKM